MEGSAKMTRYVKIMLALVAMSMLEVVAALCLIFLVSKGVQP